MRRQKRKHDFLPRILMAAFLVLGTFHCFCRFDMTTQMETFFTHAWAEATPQQIAVPGQPANGSQPYMAAAISAPQVTTIQRNPFMAPTAITEKPQTVAAAPTTGGAAGNSAAASAASSQPVLRGIAQNGGASAAIIEYAGHSGFYRVGQYVGNERVNSISNNSVSLSDGSRLVLGR